jgi:hypothetical protein
VEKSFTRIINKLMSDEEDIQRFEFGVASVLDQPRRLTSDTTKPANPPNNQPTNQSRVGEEVEKSFTRRINNFYV